MMDRRTFIGSLLLGAGVGSSVAWAQPGPRLPVIGILATGQLRTAPPYPALERALRDPRARRWPERADRIPDGRRADRAPALSRRRLGPFECRSNRGGRYPSIVGGGAPRGGRCPDRDDRGRLRSTRNRDRLQPQPARRKHYRRVVQQIALTAKRMEFLKEIAPKARRVAVLSDPFTVDQLKMAESTAGTFGLHVQPIQFRTPPYDDAAAFARLTTDRSGAALVTIGPVFFRDRAQLVEVATRQRIPTMFPLPESGTLAD